MQPNSNYTGCAAEYRFATECTSRGYIVSMPILDSSPYDAIVDTHQGIYKIQIKYTNKEPLFPHKSVHVPLEKEYQTYTIENVDYFAIYTQYFNGFFIVQNKGSMKAIRLSLHGKYSDYFNNFAFGSY